MLRHTPWILALALGAVASGASARSDGPVLEPGVYAEADGCGRAQARLRWDGERMISKGGSCVWNVSWSRDAEHGLRQTCSTPGPRPVRRDVGEARMMVSDPAGFVLKTTRGEAAYQRCLAR
ncbi:MAG: hypothetical protein AB1942_04280 [Pseudomonadota bacterium]